jgi:hypothetical protein
MVQWVDGAVVVRLKVDFVCRIAVDGAESLFVMLIVATNNVVVVDVDLKMLPTQNIEQKNKGRE